MACTLLCNLYHNTCGGLSLSYTENWSKELNLKCCPYDCSCQARRHTLHTCSSFTGLTSTKEMLNASLALP